MNSLNLIGAGNLGQTLGKVFAKHFALQGVLNQSQSSGEQAVAWMGAGTAVNTLEDLTPGDVTVITTPDERIESTCEALVAANKIKSGSVVFHCSGALPSTVLQSAQQAGAFVASIHPIHTFPKPVLFAGETFPLMCGVEGDTQALDLLSPIFKKLGAIFLPIKTEYKLQYHAGIVMACNYLVTLLHVSAKTLVSCGMDDGDALQALRPIVEQTVKNIFDLGPQAALTGPIARGEMDVVQAEFEALKDWDSAVGELYGVMAEVTKDMARS